MNENNFELVERENISPEDQKKQKMMIYRERIKRKWLMLFDKYDDGRKIIADLKLENEELLATLENKEDILRTLDECANIQNRDEFAERIFAIFEPTFNAVIEEAYKKENETERGIKILNEVISYEIVKNIARIHVFSGKKDYGFKKFVDGLHELAEIIKDKPGVKIVEAISWIITQHPKIVEKKMGFAIGGEIDPEYIKEHFSKEDGRIMRASMNRDDFLDKYLIT